MVKLKVPGRKRPSTMVVIGETDGGDFLCITPATYVRCAGLYSNANVTTVKSSMLEEVVEEPIRKTYP
jgi:hypothetical protein